MKLERSEVELSRAGRDSSLLKALPTVHWPALSRLKRNGRFFSALRARSRRFDPVVGLPVQGLIPLRFANPATLWFVLESLVGIEKLFPGSENELRSAVHTLQDSIPVLHRRTPSFEQGPHQRSARKWSDTARLVSLPLSRSPWISNPVRVWPSCVPACEPRPL